ncbi:hypothetical protein GYA37_02480 [candidate division WWE3 bacterium]|uniref:Uncharacterized protein n=1 Tax=candidate division WWE3 bacterium TaxID=2053526 RepID=A0A7X9E7G8_UNCKA|nr:hypothetical protein [candidate division WWE3 bacterium]
MYKNVITTGGGWTGAVMLSFLAKQYVLGVLLILLGIIVVGFIKLRKGEKSLKN